MTVMAADSGKRWEKLLHEDASGPGSDFQMYDFRIVSTCSLVCRKAFINRIGRCQITCSLQINSVAAGKAALLANDSLPNT